MTAIGRFNRLMEAHAVRWQKVRLEKLPATTQRYLRLLAEAQIAVEQAEQTFEGLFLFRLVQPFHGAHYLLHDSVSAGHIWGDAEFENLDPYDLGWKLAQAASGMRTRH